MTRDEAQKIVDGVTYNVAQYKAVPFEAAGQLLGEKHFERLTKDRVRGLGPCARTFYPWNVVDYLVVAANEREAIRLDEEPVLKIGGGLDRL